MEIQKKDEEYVYEKCGWYRKGRCSHPSKKQSNRTIKCVRRPCYSYVYRNPNPQIGPECNINLIITNKRHKKISRLFELLELDDTFPVHDIFFLLLDIYAAEKAENFAIKELKEKIRILKERKKESW